MFLPSEAVYAELHATFRNVVEDPSGAVFDRLADDVDGDLEHDPRRP